MKRFYVFVTALLMSSVVSAAQPSDASIDRLLQVTEAQKIADVALQSIDGMMKNMINQSIESQKLTDEGRKVIDNFSQRMIVVMKDEFSWAKLKPMYVTIYKEEFTQQEVDGLLDFYATPTGKAFIAKMPAVTQRSMVLTQQRMVPIMQRMQNEMKQAMAEVQAAEQKKAPAKSK